MSLNLLLFTHPCFLTPAESQINNQSPSSTNLGQIEREEESEFMFKDCDSFQKFHKLYCYESMFTNKRIKRIKIMTMATENSY